jgi:hypothetical protein
MVARLCGDALCFDFGLDTMLARSLAAKRAQWIVQ